MTRVSSRHRHHDDGDGPGRRPYRGQYPPSQHRQHESGATAGASLAQQVNIAAGDSVGLCMFGQTVTNANIEWLTQAINAAHGTNLTPDFYLKMGQETLRLEREFNRQAGFGVEDDELPAFFYDEPLPPSRRVCSLPRRGCTQHLRPLAGWRQGAGGQLSTRYRLHAAGERRISCRLRKQTKALSFS